MDVSEFIKEALCKGGFSEATGVELTFADGHKITVHSDNHPVLKQTVTPGEEPKVRPVQSAQGGM